MERWNDGTVHRSNFPSDLAWHLLIEPAGSTGAENMALDAALLDEADRTGAAFLRLYRFVPATLSFGRNEPAAARYDRALIERRGLPVVRRPTGGRAVWHEHEVTYAIAAPIAAFGSLRDAYLTIHRRLATALRSLGAETSLAKRLTDQPTSRLTGSCFSAPTGGEIVVHGRKLVGSAQVRQGAAFLQHGSILLDGSQEMIDEVRGERYAVRGETTLAHVLGRPVVFAEVAEAICASWGDALRPSARPSVRPRPTGSPLGSAFSDPSWTWRR